MSILGSETPIPKVKPGGELRCYKPSCAQECMGILSLRWIADCLHQSNFLVSAQLHFIRQSLLTDHTTNHCGQS